MAFEWFGCAIFSPEGQTATVEVRQTLGDRYMEKTMFRQQQKDRRSRRNREGSLYAPTNDRGEELGDYEGHTARTSLYTTAYEPGGRSERR